MEAQRGWQCTPVPVLSALNLMAVVGYICVIYSSLYVMVDSLRVTVMWRCFEYVHVVVFRLWIRLRRGMLMFDVLSPKLLQVVVLHYLVYCSTAICIASFAALDGGNQV